MLVYIRRLEHTQIPLSVGVLETKPPNGTMYSMGFLWFVAVVPF